MFSNVVSTEVLLVDFNKPGRESHLNSMIKMRCVNVTEIHGTQHTENMPGACGTYRAGVMSGSLQVMHDQASHMPLLYPLQGIPPGFPSLIGWW